jgi:hypothetical protein
MTEREWKEKNLYDFFTELLQEQGITDMPLIYGGESGVRPKPPFLMLEFRSLASLGMPERSMVSIRDDGKDMQRITQHMRQSMTMYGFGESAAAALETVKAQLGADIWTDKLRLRGLVIPQLMESFESPSGFETETEKGAGFDFDLTYTRISETHPGYIEHIILNGRSASINYNFIGGVHG